MSFSSTSSKESSSVIPGTNNTNENNSTVLHSSSSEPVSTPLCDIQSKPFENNTRFLNGNDNKNSISQPT
ncbi:unnamed protein product, partial [Rotaria sordida]